jgi:hypothetical protein
MEIRNMVPGGRNDRVLKAYQIDDLIEQNWRLKARGGQRCPGR